MISNNVLDEPEAIFNDLTHLDYGSQVGSIDISDTSESLDDLHYFNAIVHIAGQAFI